MPIIGAIPPSMPCAYSVPVDNFRALTKMLGGLGNGWAVENADFDKAEMARLCGFQLYLGELGYWITN